LIELLVVIAVIAILAAILFPVFSQARERARQAQCQSNLKQIALATGMYLQDYDETFPISGYFGTGNQGACFFSTDRILWPYIKNTSVWRCPSNPTGTNMNKAALASLGMPLCSLPAPDAENFSYMLNQSVVTSGEPSSLVLATTGGKFDGTPAVRLAQVEYPADTPIVFDALLTGPGGSCSFSDSLLEGLHNSMVEATYADGHTKAVKTQLTSSQCVTMDGNTVAVYVAADAGAYQGLHTLQGIPYRKLDGSWGLH
jgi:type II secretory pathway pseudopilin PulG